MSLQDRLASQDGFQLLTTGASLSLVTATSMNGSGYNFPLMLFGIVGHEMRSSYQPFRQFLILILFTAVFDIYTLITHPLSGFVKLVTLLLALLKLPIFFTCLAQLRERGGDLFWGQASAGFHGLGMPRGGQANWSMPGNFTPGQPPPAAPPPPGSFPSTGGFRLGTEDENEQDDQPPPPPPAGRGGYQTIG